MIDINKNIVYRVKFVSLSNFAPDIGLYQTISIWTMDSWTQMLILGNVRFSFVGKIMSREWVLVENSEMSST